MHPLLNTLFALAACWAVYSDFRYRRISNLVTFGAAAVALIIRAVFGGAPAAIAGLEGWALGVAIFVLPFALGWMGAADVKLLAAFGALGGPTFVLQAALMGCVFGGVMSIFCLVRERRLGFTLAYFGHLVSHPLGGGAIALKRRMPFGPALAAGAAASLVLTHAVL